MSYKKLIICVTIYHVTCDIVKVMTVSWRILEAVRSESRIIELGCVLGNILHQHQLYQRYIMSSARFKMFAYENANESHNCIIFNTVRNKASLRFSQISKVKCKPYITLAVNIGPNSFVSHPPTQFKRRKLKLIRRPDISIDSGNGLSPGRRLAII